MSAAQVIAGYEQIIAQAHAAGLKIFGATLTPFEGVGYYTAAGEAKREAVNQWIRTSGAFDEVIDFDKVVLTDDRRLAAPRLPRRTNRAPPVTPISLCCFSLRCGVVPGDDVRLRDGRQRCASPTTRGCRRKREQSLPAASLRLLAQEPDVDPARVPEATGATIRRHRRRDRDRLDGVGDQPSPCR